MAWVIAWIVGGGWLLLVAYGNLNAWPDAPSQQPNDYGEDERTS